MRTVRSFANEEAEVHHYGAKLKHTLGIYKKKSAVYGSWMLSNSVSSWIHTQYTSTCIKARMTTDTYEPV